MIELLINRDGRVALAGQTIKIEQLTAMLTKSSANDKSILVTADKNLPSTLLLGILGCLKKTPYEDIDLLLV